MTRFSDLTGLRFGRLVVLERDESRYRLRWLAICDCGKTKSIDPSSLKSGSTRSCGCLSREVSSSRTYANGYGDHKKGLRVYKVWETMISRCVNTHARSYSDYGGRGISVCERWNVFDNFLEDMGNPDDGYVIDRIDNDGNYEPSNCRWVTPTQNARNKRNTIKYDFCGKRMTLGEISESIGVKQTTLWARIKSGWSANDAFSTPAREISPKGSARPHIRKRKLSLV